MKDLLINPVVIYPAISWCIAQVLKVLIYYIKDGKLDWRFLIWTGGMPSSHSAFACSIAATVAFRDGLNSSLFGLAIGLAIIVMADAAGLRRAAGQQATIVNHIVEELFQGHPISDEKLKELLGHTPTQVFAGALLGILCTLVGILWIWNGT